LNLRTFCSIYQLCHVDILLVGNRNSQLKQAEDSLLRWEQLMRVAHIFMILPAIWRINTEEEILGEHLSAARGGKFFLQTPS
jgi:hypothetical protein